MSDALSLESLLERNRVWRDQQVAKDPEFFSRLANQQAPKYLWIGCSDSRVPANELLNLPPGEMFVHRNVANLVIHTDFNCLSVLQYAVEILNVEHIIVCGHYGCGGIKAALGTDTMGLIDNWLRHVQDVHDRYRDELDALPPEQQVNRLCELNVIQQVRDVTETTVVRNAWRRGQPVQVHGWIYDVADGLLRDLEVTQERLP